MRPCGLPFSLFFLSGERDANDPGGERAKHGAGDQDPFKTPTRRRHDLTPAETAEEEQGKEEDVIRGPHGDEHNLWEQMTAREGRAAARLAGMRAGDWQAERQLQEALRESRRVRPEGRGIEEGGVGGKA